MPAKTHGMTDTREYRCWSNMIQRCYNTKASSFPWYGGRGIGVCQRWRVSFEEFFGDMGYCPAGYTIERIDCDGDYQPANCKWTPREKQAANQRSNKVIALNGERHYLTEWARKLHLPKGALVQRRLKGKKPEEVLDSRLRPRNRTIEWNGETKTIAEWAKTVGLKRDTLYSRLYVLGWSVEKALTTQT